MAVGSAVNRISYSGNNSIVTAYAIPFRFDSGTWLRVTVTNDEGTVQTYQLGVDYELIVNEDLTTDSIRTIVAVPATSKLTISRYTPAFQTLVMIANSQIAPKDLERALDQMVMALQDRDASGGTAYSKALTFPLSEPEGHVTELPMPADRKNSLIYFDPNNGSMQVIDVATLADRIQALGKSDGGYRDMVMSADLVMTGATAQILDLDPNGANRNVALPPVGTAAGAVSPGWAGTIHHSGTANVIYVRTAGGALLCTLLPGEAANLRARTASNGWVLNARPSNAPFTITRSGVDIVNPASEDIFTVPAGLVFVLLRYDVRIRQVVNYVGSGSYPIFKLFGSISGQIGAQSTIDILTATNRVNWSCFGIQVQPAPVGTPGEIIRFVKDTPANNAAQIICDVSVTGYYMPA